MPFAAHTLLFPLPLSQPMPASPCVLSSALLSLPHPTLWGISSTRLNIPMDDHASLRRTCEKELTAINRKLSNPATRRKAEFLSTQRTQVSCGPPPAPHLPIVVLASRSAGSHALPACWNEAFIPGVGAHVAWGGGMEGSYLALEMLVW